VEERVGEEEEMRRGVRRDGKMRSWRRRITRAQEIAVDTPPRAIALALTNRNQRLGLAPRPDILGKAHGLERLVRIYVDARLLGRGHGCYGEPEKAGYCCRAKRTEGDEAM
jgi:hypothetical protein